MLSIRKIALGVALLSSSITSFAFTVTQTADSVTIHESDYTMNVLLSGFRFSFSTPSGETIASANPDAGLYFGTDEGGAASSSQLIHTSEHKLTFDVVNRDGYKATVDVYPKEHNVRLSVIPGSARHHFKINIATILGPLNAPVYGLGDMGGGNVYGVNRTLQNDGGVNRFITDFTVAPSKSFAQVSMIKAKERAGNSAVDTVAADDTETKVGANGVSKLTHIDYFIGDMPTIYKAFKVAKAQAGYPDAKPNAQLFKLGWEAWPTLQWKSDQKSVMNAVSEFKQHDYSLGWIVIGSGFWKNGGTTTSFGEWNPTAYPDPQAMINELHENNIDLLLGLRTVFPVSSSQASLGLENHYFAVDAADNPIVYQSTVFPKATNFYTLSAGKKDAVEQWMKDTEKWHADGWKEDSMINKPDAYYNGFANAPMTALSKRGDLVMARNAYISSPGSIQRLNDTSGEQSRIPKLALAYGASGAPNVYPDDIGNGSQDKDYLVRHTLLSAVTAGMAFGRNPWDYDSDYSTAMFKAAEWHNSYAPYIYNAALKSYKTGYPYTLTPLPIAYPQDSSTYNLTNNQEWEWMLGESLLAAPAFANGGWTRDVYLPKGTWIDFNSHKVFHGPCTLKSYTYTMNDIPVFVGGKGVLVSETEDKTLDAHVWPVTDGTSKFTFHYKDGTSTSTITNRNKGWNTSTLRIKDITADKSVKFQVSQGVYSFTLTKGHNYVIIGGK